MATGNGDTIGALLGFRVEVHMRPALLTAVLVLSGFCCSVKAEVTRVTVASRAVVAEGQSFGTTGPYEKLTGTIEFAIDIQDKHNKPIVDLEYAPRGSDGRVHFSSDLYVLRPVDPARGNGVLLFEILNRGGKGLLARFNRANSGNAADPNVAADFGDGFLMREGYTLVWVGWEFDVPAPLQRITAPQTVFPPGQNVAPLKVMFISNERAPEAFLIDAPTGRPPVRYPPAQTNNTKDVLTVRDRFWDKPVTVPRASWRFVMDANNTPKVRLDTGFEPGRIYEVEYQTTGAVVAGVGFAAIRDAASAFRYRSDLPITGRSAYVFGASQSGRFLREFLYSGFNADEHDRRVFEAAWPHIAGAGLGPFNERFAQETHGSPYVATRFPFTDLDQRDTDGRIDGIEKIYTPAQRPKIFYTNTSVEYWGGGRAAALTHTTLDGKQDAKLPDNVRIYLLAGTQHGESVFPPPITLGQQLNNPTPQANVMRALLRALHDWESKGSPPPESQYPRLSDHTLVSAVAVKFPALPGVGEPRSITGPARVTAGKIDPWPFLVSQVDADGNELAGIRVPDLSVPLATATGWNFRAKSLGNPGDIYTLLGSYIPFAQTRAEREARKDPRLSIEERYKGREDYLNRIRAAAMKLVQGRYLLNEDMHNVLDHAAAHWDYANRSSTSSAVH